MNRRELLATCGAALVSGAAGCAAPKSGGEGVGEETSDDATEGETSAEEVAEQWPMFLHGSASAGVHQRVDVGGEAVGPVVPRDRRRGMVESVAADGTLYVGSFDQNIYVLDAETGEKKWMYGTRGNVRSSPAIVGTTLYIGARTATF